jgi:hypothetical protein
MNIDTDRLRERNVRLLVRTCRRYIQQRIKAVASGLTHSAERLEILYMSGEDEGKHAARESVSWLAGVFRRRRALRIYAAMIVMIVSLSQGCSTAVLQGIGQTASDAAGASAPNTIKLMIFGGPDHQTYLGCLNCSQYAADSVYNQYGEHGSPYSRTSIWNHYGDFGSPYSTYSSCNPYATDPPVIVDQSGNAYGRVTVNQYATGIGAGAKLYDWLVSTVCANWTFPALPNLEVATMKRLGMILATYFAFVFVVYGLAMILQGFFTHITNLCEVGSVIAPIGLTFFWFQRGSK